VTDTESFDVPVGRTVVQELPYVERCGTAFVAGGLTDTYSPAKVGSAKPLACFRPMIPIAVSASR
jgi:hypothetical protein